MIEYLNWWLVNGPVIGILIHLAILITVCGTIDSVFESIAKALSSHTSRKPNKALPESKTVYADYTAQELALLERIRAKTPRVD